MPFCHTPRTGHPWLALVLMLTSMIATAGRTEETEAVKALKRARRNGAEMIQAGRFSRAVAYLRRATGLFPEDGELHRLLAAAALDQAMEVDNRLETAQSRLAMLSAIRSAIAPNMTSEFKDSAALIET